MSICIIAHNAYGAMTGGGSGHVGGAEHQTSLMARWFASRGYEISLLTWDEGQPPEIMIAGVKVIKMARHDAGIPILRFIHPRVSSLYAALKKADADIYYHNSAESYTGLIAAWCRHYDKKFIYSIASDVACMPELSALTRRHERIFYRYGLKNADNIIVQTKRQQELLKKGFGLNSTPLPMPCPGPDKNESIESLPPKRPRVVWVGRIAAMKRLDWFLEIATFLPEVQFHIAAANMDSSSYAQELYSKAGLLKNVNWLGTVPRENIPSLYKNTLCLCCTSLYEGFPNTFLEAWSYGCPVVSTFDPDGMIDRFNLGMYRSDIMGMINAIQSLVNNPVQWSDISRKTRSYYLDNHQIDIAMPRFENNFLKTFST